MDVRVLVIDEDRFCPIGTIDLTFDECQYLERDRALRLPAITRNLPMSFDRSAQDVVVEAVHPYVVIRPEKFHRRTSAGRHQTLTHVIVRSDEYLDDLRRTGRFRDWDADLRNSKPE